MLHKKIISQGEKLRLLTQTLNLVVPEHHASQIKEMYQRCSESDWHDLFKLADQTMLLCNWYWVLSTRNWLASMPAALQDAGEAALLLNRERNRVLLSEAEHVSSLLAEIECPTVYLKGMGHLLARTYQDIGARMTSDMDILIPPERVLDAAHYLLKKGACLTTPYENSTLKISEREHHLPSLQMPKSVGFIELHYSFVSQRRIWPTVEDILSNARPAPYRPQCLVPNSLHASAMAIAHSFLREGGPPGAAAHVKDISDFVTMLNANDPPDLQNLQKEMAAAGQDMAFGGMIRVSVDLFGVSVENKGLENLSTKQRLGGWLAILFLDFRVKHYSLFIKSKVLVNAYRFALFSKYRSHIMRIIFDREYYELWRKVSGRE